MTQKHCFGSTVYVSGWSFSLLNVKKLWKPHKLFHIISSKKYSNHSRSDITVIIAVTSKTVTPYCSAVRLL